MKNKHTPLQKTLLTNASFSFITATQILILPNETAAIMGFSESIWLQYIATGLILFSLLVGYTAIFKSHKRRWIQFIIMQDILWVLGSTIMVVIQPWGLSLMGVLLIISVALVVDFFAWKQYTYLDLDRVKN